MKYDTLHCNNCQKSISPGSENQYKSKFFCEDCCITIRTSLVRKTHWQYIDSVMESYLIQGSKEAKNTFHR
jgi:hypothetical protein